MKNNLTSLMTVFILVVGLGLITGVFSTIDFSADETKDFEFQIEDQVVKTGERIDPKLSAMLDVDDDGEEVEISYITFLVVDNKVKDAKLERTNLDHIGGFFSYCNAEDRRYCRKYLTKYSTQIEKGKHDIELVYVQSGEEDSPREHAFRDDWGACGFETEEMRQADEEFEDVIPCEYLKFKCHAPSNENCVVEINENVIGVQKDELLNSISIDGDTYMNKFGPIDIFVVNEGDDDNDGIKNLNDRCPQEPGVEKNDGCPLTFFDKLESFFNSFLKELEMGVN